MAEENLNGFESEINNTNDLMLKFVDKLCKLIKISPRGFKQELEVINMELERLQKQLNHIANLADDAQKQRNSQPISLEVKE